MLNVNDVATRLNISAATVYGLVRAGLLACHRISATGKRGCIRVAEADLAVLLESLKTQKGQVAVKPPAPKTAKPKPVRLQHLKLKPA